VLHLRIALSNAGLDWRGTETDTLVLAKGLIARGHQIVVFCRPHSAISKIDVPVEPVLSGRDFDPFAIMRARHALRKHRTQIVITQKDKDLRLTGIAARTLGIPVLVRHVTDRPLKNKRRYRWLFDSIATHHMANSEATRATVLASAPWLNADIPIIHNGIDVAAFANAQPADFGLNSDAVKVGFVGAFELRKGIIDFAEAWQRVAAAVPNAHAIIAGHGGKEAEFRNALANAPRVHWLGFRDDIANVLKSLDVFVLPSHFEGFGLVLAEAMAAGAAPVAYNTSNMPELIRNGETGVLVEPRNVSALANAIVSLCHEEALRKRIGQAAQAHAQKHFTAERMVEQHEGILRSSLLSSQTTHTDI
jgi:glycosyltransferase involved in cell wall biosynthesis